MKPKENEIMKDDLKHFFSFFSLQIAFSAFDNGTRGEREDIYRGFGNNFCNIFDQFLFVPFVAFKKRTFPTFTYLFIYLL